MDERVGDLLARSVMALDVNGAIAEDALEERRIEGEIGDILTSILEDVSDSAKAEIRAACVEILH